MAEWVPVAGIPSDGGKEALGRKWELVYSAETDEVLLGYTGHRGWLHQCPDWKDKLWECEPKHYTQHAHGKLRVQNRDSNLWHVRTQHNMLCWKLLPKKCKTVKYIWEFIGEFFRTECSEKINWKEWVSIWDLEEGSHSGHQLCLPLGIHLSFFW